MCLVFPVWEKCRDLFAHLIMVKAEIEMLKKSLFSLKLFWEQDDECLHTGTKLKKITKKVEFNIASEASNVNILSGQKFIKNGRF